MFVRGPVEALLHRACGSYRLRQPPPAPTLAAEFPYDAVGAGMITIIDTMRVAADWGDMYP